MKHVSGKSCKEKSKHFIFSGGFFSPKFLQFTR